MLTNKRRLDIILKGSLFMMWVQCAIWIATVSTISVATNASSDSLSHKQPVSLLTQTLVLAASVKIASNSAGSKSNSAKPPTTTKPVRFLDDFGELPGVQKDDDDYETFVNTTAKTTTVRIPAQEKGAVSAFLAGARPSVNGNLNQAGETDNATVANKTSGVLKKSLPSEPGSVNRTSVSSNPGKNSTTGRVQAAAAAEINSTKLPATRDFKFPNGTENLSKVPNDKNDNDKRSSTAIKTADSPIHQRVEVNPSSKDEQKPIVRNENNAKINTLLGAVKTKESHAVGVSASKTFSTTPNVTGNGTHPLKKVTIVSKLNINITSKTNKSNVTSKDMRDDASDVKTFASRNITISKNRTATRPSIKDIPLKTDASNSTSVMTNDSRRIAANIQSSKPSVVASNVTSIGNISNTRNQTSKALKFKSVLEIDKSNTTHGISKGKASDPGNMKHRKQPAPTSNTTDAGSINKTSNQKPEISNVNRTLNADKSVATSNVAKDKTNSAGNVGSKKTLKIASNLTGTNDTNKAENKISASLKLKNTLNLDTANPLSIVLKGKESNISKLNSKPPKNTTGNGKTTKTSNQTLASLTLMSVLKISMSNITINVTEDKGNNAGNTSNRKQPATISNFSETDTSSKTLNRTSTTSNTKAALNADKSNTPSNATEYKNVDSPRGKKPSTKTSNTTGTGSTNKTNDHNSAAESIRATLKAGRPTLNATFNTSNDKEVTFGNIKKKQSVVNLNMTSTGNITKTNNQTSTILVFKSSSKKDKSDITSDLTKDKRNSIDNVKRDKKVPTTSSVKEPKTKNLTS